MTTTPDNPPAFPTDHGLDEVGMTLRDYFAAKAMQPMVVAPPVPTNPGEQPEQAVARLSYAMADAMLTVRNRRAES